MGRDGRLLRWFIVIYLYFRDFKPGQVMPASAIGTPG